MIPAVFACSDILRPRGKFASDGVSVSPCLRSADKLFRE
jgi:hypothetical protein